MRVLIVNAGSSSVKLAVVQDGEKALAQREEDTRPDQLDDHWWDEALAALPEADAVGHRVVHGGTGFVSALLLDDAAVEAIDALTPLAPLHQPSALEAIARLRSRLATLPQVACFDTAVFSALPAGATTYAIPEEWRERFGVRRYGFHGLSHAYQARRVGELGLRRHGGGPLRLVSCHLGSGASLAAFEGGRPLDTTMGFTPAEGLVMGTRPGLTDPGMAAYLLRRGVGLDELEAGVEHRSGLAGLAGTPDLKQVLASAEAGDARATLAREVYLRRLAAQVAAMVAALGGVDVVTFTGGVGEHAPAIRAATVRRLGFLGLALDEDANEALGCSEGPISAESSAVSVLVVPAREDLEIAGQVERLLGAGEHR